MAAQDVLAAQAGRWALPMTTGTLGGGGLVGDAKREVSGAMTSVIVRYVRRIAVDLGVSRMMQLAGDLREPYMIEDPTSWSSHDQAIALFTAATQVTGDADIGLHVGEEMLRQHDGTEVANLLRSLGSPGELLRNVAAAAAKFTTVSTMEPLEVGDAHAVVRAVTRPGLTRHIQMCNFTRGLLSQVPVLFGLVPAVVAESECQARGGRFCLYSVAWEAGQWSSFVDERTSLYTMAWDDAGVVEARSEIELDETTRVAQLQEQVAQITTRLEDVFSTAADLLATDDIDGVLSRITERAAHAVNAPQYLLVVQTAPDAPFQLHHHGLTDSDAQALAADLLKDQPDDRGGSRLIVDIASSRRHYGRLAAVYPPGMRFFAKEHQILAVYGNYAATALDVVTALDETRRSNATARALLDFSRALSAARTIDEIAQQLADTVPAVTGCKGATVMSWDPDSIALTALAYARTNGDRPIGRSQAPLDTGQPHGAGQAGGTSEGSAPGGTGTAHDQRLDTTSEVHEATPREDGSSEPVVVRPSDTPIVERLRSSREIVVVDAGTTEDAFLRKLLSDAGTAIAVVAPLFSSDEFLGVVVASFGQSADASLATGRDLRERLYGLADQAAVAIQGALLLDQVSRMAWHDALTGLPNRRLLEDRVNQELTRSKRSGDPVCMFFIDLDRFKQVNDTLGHAAGDDLIQQVAARLSDTVRRQDTVARLGGDEFAVLLPGISDPAAVDQLARRALDTLHRPYLIAGQEVFTSASIGVAIAPMHGQTYDELLSNADAAMYRSKGLGRNTFQMFNAADADTTSGSAQLESDLHHAVERGEMFVLYQPFIDLQTTSIVGVEALVRWRHPTKGVLEPDVFISLAEESNLIVQIDSWVAVQACHQMRAWRENGLPPLRVAVNISTRDLAGDQFVEAVTGALAATGVDPRQLELEVTERVVMDDVGPKQANVERLQELGVRFSIDDFGVGDSSLTRFGSFPVSTLKIDQSFVQVLGPEDASSTLVSAIISMARELGIECVAEGVETSHQSRVLLQRGCTTAQGFFFSPPLLPNDVERMLKDAESTPPTIPDDPAGVSTMSPVEWDADGDTPHDATGTQAGRSSGAVPGASRANVVQSTNDVVDGEEDRYGTL